MVFIWDAQREIFVDEMGIPSSLDDVRTLQRLATQVVATNTPETLAKQCRQIMEERYPAMAQRFDYSPERFA